MTFPLKWRGDRYDEALSNADVAALLRKELKKRFPDYSFSVTRDITVTVTGRDFRSSTDEITALGVRVSDEVVAACNRWRYYDRNPLSGYCSSNFTPKVIIAEKLSRSDIADEKDRLKREYWITDWDTLRETMFNVDAKSPLTRVAFLRLYDELKPKSPKPELNHAVTAELMRWIEKVKTWIDDPDIQFDRGPKFWKVMRGKRVLCYVNGIDGTIYKSSYGPQTKSPRGTIFDGINVFCNGRLLRKRAFDWLVYFSKAVGKSFPAISDAWAYAKVRSKLRELLKREPTSEEIELVASEEWSIAPGASIASVQK